MCKKEMEMDQECVELCNALDIIPGIKTRSSCCGHDETPYWVLFDADNNESLANVLWVIERIPYNKEPKQWAITLKVVFVNNQPKIIYKLTGPIGKRESLELAKRLESCIR
jgi:tRNA(Phe) wybutosine-synthesizing methylase Tyw3